MNGETKALIEGWVREHGSILDRIAELEAANPRSRYGAAIAAYLAALDTERRPDA